MRFADIDQRREVVPIHGDDVVEVLEVLRAHLATAQVIDIDAAPAGGLAGALVRRASHVPGRDSGGVDLDHVAQPFILYQAPEYALGSRRSADVSKTHEQDLDHCSCSASCWRSNMRMTFSRS